MEAKEYVDEIQRAAAMLNRDGFNAQVRGEGMSVFLFAEVDSWAIELYRSEDGILVEFWKPDEIPAGLEQVFPSLQQATTACASWLKDHVPGPLP